MTEKPVGHRAGTRRRLIIEDTRPPRKRRVWKWILLTLALLAAGFVWFLCSWLPTSGQNKNKAKPARRSARPPAAQRPGPSTFLPGHGGKGSAAGKGKGEALSRAGEIRPSSFSAEIWRRILRIDPELRAARRELAASAERAGQEEKTGKLLLSRLGSTAFKLEKGLAGNGVLAVLTGKQPGGVVALLAYMDGTAVRKSPVTGSPATRVEAGSRAARAGPRAASRAAGARSEASGPTGRSRRRFAHLKGHDVQMAVLIGVAKVLSELKDKIPGTLKLIFQPGRSRARAQAGGATDVEERGGAFQMIRHGVLTAPRVDALFALSVQPGLRLGQLGIPVEQEWLARSRFSMVVYGRNLSACLSPSAAGCVDPVSAAAQLVVQIQSQALKQGAGAGSGGLRLTLERIESRGASGRVPSQVAIEGSLRWKQRVHRDRMEQAMRRVVRGLTVSSGARITLSFREGRRIVPSDPGLVRWLLPTVRRALGPKALVMGSPAVMDPEFSLYQRRVPSVMLQLGTHSIRIKTERRLGQPGFDVDEECISVGVHLLANLALDFLLDRAKTKPSTRGTSSSARSTPNAPSTANASSSAASGGPGDSFGQGSAGR